METLTPEEKLYAILEEKLSQLTHEESEQMWIRIEESIKRATCEHAGGELK
jgi:hypothetical protein